MKKTKLTIAVGLTLAACVANAAGPLYLWDGGSEPTPYKWDTSNGPIPVWTDGGEAFTFDYDGVTPFITIERANEITAFAFNEWTEVSTSTFSAEIAGTIEEQIGVADINSTNADAVYGPENGYGFWVVYDTDGYILENTFGVPRTAVLGIAFPEWADETTGEITEATALMNGYNVHDSDVDGNKVAGVFTHEFGHAINLSHTQVNGHIAYQSYPWAPEYPGAKGCVDPVFRWNLPPFYGPTANPVQIETMFPFIDHYEQPGQEMSTIDMPDDIAAISTLYPTADFADTTGTISGVLRLKDGKTEYAGINVIARNVNDPMGDAISSMTGSATNGLVGPDGRYTINGLTPGEQYVVYIEQVNSGGYPTGRSPVVSVAEYWNEAESNDPTVDEQCDATPILAEAGTTKTADIIFNGYNDGIVYTPIVSAHLTDLAKNGKKSSGIAGNTAFIWDENHEFTVLPPELIASSMGAMTRNGQKMLVQYDTNDNGIHQAAIIDLSGQSGKGKVISLGDLSDDSCGGSSSSGVASSSGWAIDDSGHTAVGLAYIDQDGDGLCQKAFADEIVPWVWTAGKKGGMRMLDTSLDSTPQFIRAHGISGNGRVILGGAGFRKAVAWIDEGPIIDLGNEFGAWEAYAVNYDGSRVGLITQGSGVILWNALTGESENIGTLRWCDDVPFVHFFLGNLCEKGFTHEDLAPLVGEIYLAAFDMNDEGTVIVGRAGTGRTGYTGAIWIEGLGWMSLEKFLYKQGVIEAASAPMDNPMSIDGYGDTIVGGLAGFSMAWHVDMKEVIVCKDGSDFATDFPVGMMELINDGAEFGRCAFID
jgi:hypothetical protein